MPMSRNEGAENALRQMAHDDDPKTKWEVGTTHHILRLSTNSGQPGGYDYDDDEIELKVERVRLKPKGCIKEVALKRPRGEGESEEDGNEEGGA